MKKAIRSNKGFSLVELIIVIAITAILVSLLVPNLLGFVTKAKKVADVKTAETIGTALERVLIFEEAAGGQWNKISSIGNQIILDVKDPATGESYRINNVLELNGNKFRSAAGKDSQYLCDLLADELCTKDVKISYTTKYIKLMRISRNRENGRVEVWASNDKEGRSSTVFYRLYPDPDPAFYENTDNPVGYSGRWASNSEKKGK